MDRVAKIGETLLYKLNQSNCTRYQEQLAKAGMSANSHEEGQIVPLIVTKIWNPNYINGVLLLDGPMPMWVTSVGLGDQPGQFAFQE